MKYNEYRRATRAVRVGDVLIGGNSPITVQSMTNTDPHDTRATIDQIIALADAGCDIVRLSIPDSESAAAITEAKAQGVRIPLVADIHYSYKVAIAAVEAGADKIRINPGNIGSATGVSEIVRACRERGIPIRIGVNSGSLDKDILEKYKAPTAEALAESAIREADMLSEMDFHDIVLSIKSSDPMTMIRANRLVASRTDYPLHLGVTEAGAGTQAIIKSSVGVGSLLSEGIGDTLRISLTDDPCREIEAAESLLRALELTDKRKMEIISCPTCGRTKIDLISLHKSFQSAAIDAGIDKNDIKVALMGCGVNGPGEAREADIGIAGGSGEALLFKRGEIICKIPESQIIPRLIDEIRAMQKNG
ncbi:MAG: flavodoxin-dependent (E)-4-hydroxy-3-methylbut-2-enyl-diphosphate synthase [Clostridia bacterium]|nr:flavodoxin-dependent (E)-4-hydroxy-3-methylbut-2-enyl-diphosphate synthase [Clostridia bacterium]